MSSLVVSKSRRLIKAAAIVFWLVFVGMLLVFTFSVWHKEIFDRLIYRKSYQFGYSEKVNKFTCRSQLNSDEFRDNNLYPKKEGEYLIMTIGDSYVYGLGLLKKQRFTEKLENKLKQIRPTRVVNLGICGTNIYEHFVTNLKYRNKINPDLVVIGISENDLLILPNLENYPWASSPPGKDLFEDIPENQDLHIKQILGSLNQGSGNMDMLKYLLTKFSDQGTIYLSFAYGYEGEFGKRLSDMYSLFINQGLTLINPDSLYWAKYLKLSEKRDGIKSMVISKKELHPNDLANSMYAEVLFNEITSNPKWEF